MRVVLDTNVIIAAFAARGLCSEVFQVCITRHSIITSEHILSEVSEKLINKICLPKKIALDIIDYLREHTELVTPEMVDESVCRDKDDDTIIATALSGKARLIITGDDDLLMLKKYRDIDIITPREFWNLLNS